METLLLGQEPRTEGHRDLKEGAHGKKGDPVIGIWTRGVERQRGPSLSADLAEVNEGDVG